MQEMCIYDYEHVEVEYYLQITENEKNSTAKKHEENNTQWIHNFVLSGLYVSFIQWLLWLSTTLSGI